MIRIQVKNLLHYKNVILEHLDLTVAKNVDIVRRGSTAIISLEAAQKGAYRDTKEKNAKIVRASVSYS